MSPITDNKIPARGFLTLPAMERGLGLIVLSAVLAMAAPAAVRADVGVGDSFPSLAAAGLMGAALPPTTGKIVLVDFWASWCAPCKASFPAYGRLQGEFADKGVVIVAVSVDQDASAYEAFVRKMSPPFYVALDKAQKLVGVVRVPTMPTSYLIDPQGRVRFIHQGFHGSGTEADIRKEIGILLSENKS